MDDLVERLRTCADSDMVPMEKAMNLLLEAANALEATRKDVMRVHDLEANWSRCSRACAGEQTKREQAEARAVRLAEALQWYVDNDDTNDGQEGNEFWLAGRDRARALLREQEKQ